MRYMGIFLIKMMIRHYEPFNGYRWRAKEDGMVEIMSL